MPPDFSQTVNERFNLVFCQPVLSTSVSTQACLPTAHPPADLPSRFQTHMDTFSSSTMTVQLDSRHFFLGKLPIILWFGKFLPLPLLLIFPLTSSNWGHFSTERMVFFRIISGAGINIPFQKYETVTHILKHSISKGSWSNLHHFPRLQTIQTSCPWLSTIFPG